MSDFAAFKGARAVVTGGAGFIGSHLVDGLLGHGAEVVVLDSFATGRRENLAHVEGSIRLVEGDIRDVDTCRAALEGAAYVFHQAALGSVPRSMEDPATSFAVNVGGTANVFSAARDVGAKRVVYASSSSIYGDDDRLPKREGNEGRPLSPYALSKRMDEDLADVFARCYGMGFVGLRYFNVYGPRQDPSGPYAAVIPRFFAACAVGAAPKIFGDGQHSRDFTFVKDVVDANLLAALCPADACGAYNIGAGGRTTVLELATAICRITGCAAAPELAEPRPGDVLHSMADISRAREKLGYDPRVLLDEGIRLTYAG